jgi:hypothetical protein
MFQIERNSYNRYLFLIGAVWNWIAALSFILITIIDKEQLEIVTDIIPETLFWLQGFMGAVFVFGIGYYWVSTDFERNRDIVKMGIIAKALVFILVSAYFLMRDATLLGLIPGVIDLLFAVLFLETLARTESITPP